MYRTEKSNKITTSLIISILAFAVSLSTFIYTIYKDNKESLVLWCLEYHCISDHENGYITSGKYIVTNNSHKNISVIDAYVVYDGTRISSSLDQNNIFPIVLNAGESYQITIEPQYSSTNLEAPLFEVKIISSSQKQYSTKSKYF